MFEVPVKRHLGLVAFRLRGDDQPTEQLLRLMNSRGRVHCVPAQLPDKRYIIRFTVTSARTTMKDIEEDWQEIRHVADLVIGENEEICPPIVKQKVMLKGIFGSPTPFFGYFCTVFCLFQKHEHVVMALLAPLCFWQIHLCHPKSSMAASQLFMSTKRPIRCLVTI